LDEIHRFSGDFNKLSNDSFQLNLWTSLLLKNQEWIHGTERILAMCTTPRENQAIYLFGKSFALREGQAHSNLLWLAYTYTKNDLLVWRWQLNFKMSASQYQVTGDWSTLNWKKSNLHLQLLASCAWCCSLLNGDVARSWCQFWWPNV